MSLQVPATQLSNVVYPTCDFQDYSAAIKSLNGIYPSKNRKLDAITEQMVKTNDARVKVMDDFVSGALCQWWEEKGKIEPNATSVMGLIDRVCGLGKYHPDNQKSDALTEKAEKNDDVHQEEVNHHEKESLCGWWESLPGIARICDIADRIFLRGKYRLDNRKDITTKIEELEKKIGGYWYCENGQLISWFVLKDAINLSNSRLGDIISRLGLIGKYLQLKPENEVKNCLKLFFDWKCETNIVRPWKYCWWNSCDPFSESSIEREEVCRNFAPNAINSHVRAFHSNVLAHIIYIEVYHKNGMFIFPSSVIAPKDPNFKQARAH